MNAPGTSDLNPLTIRLADAGLVLSPFVPEDAPDLLDLALESATEIRPWMRWTDSVTDLTGASAMILEWERQWFSEEGFAFGARDAASGRMVGGGSLNQFNRKNAFANLAYWVRTGERGRGIAPRLTRMLSQFGFEHLGLNRVEILMEPANTASLRVAEKAGAVREGLLRHRILNRGEPRTAVVFSLIPSDLGLGTEAGGSVKPAG